MRGTDRSAHRPMTEQIQVQMREPTPSRVQRVAGELGVSTGALMKGDVPDEPTPGQIERVLPVLCEDHYRFSPREWSKSRREWVLGALLGKFCVSSLVTYG